MRPFILNDDEIQHINLMRRLATDEKVAIYTAVSELAAPRREAPYGGNVVALDCRRVRK